MKFISLAIIIASVGFCTPKCDETAPSDVYTFPDNMEELIPYENQEKFTLVHNSGTEILFEVQRNSTVETISCDHCCDYFTYESEDLRVFSDYPFYDIQFNINAEEEENYSYGITIGREYFSLNERIQTVDSVRIKDQYFHDVFKMKSDSYREEYEIEIDSLYFNYSIGILKIVQVHGDTYEIQ
jgi:hypothetical protein